MIGSARRRSRLEDRLFLVGKTCDRQMKPSDPCGSKEVATPVWCKVWLALERADPVSRWLEGELRAETAVLEGIVQ